ncbi:dynein heavy chain and region d6 of dynein motor domain-containing protein [Ditylenchus destructor]|uniref:Dynein heavy chain, cytoplasmic n=1 Tax=Ditylenchus destructor TaxID=166010 RepID=A0AAD4RD57_9BILA|nr:dynein heavy chain and region d6 of dynein motor domain-containing protein [Ditylenchus destructor]
MKMDDYIISIASILLGENDHRLLQNALESAADDLQRFISDQQTSVFAVNRCVVREYVHDTIFLNALQNGVNRWITEIRKITKLDRDPSSGTALQEVTFWMNLERAISRVNEMRESEEVVLTLEALKLGKRFHATVSFDADTGLKETAAKVTDYNQIMKDIPLNDLVSATDVIGVRQALANIFAALRKIRNSKYPAKRAMDFFAAISSDTCSQIIRIVRPRRLMHLPITELDEIMKSCYSVFAYWDEEGDKLQSMFRELAKKQKMDVKYTTRIHFRHKQLEQRFDELHKFRKQHEQLSNVIARVLRSSGGMSLDAGDQDGPDKQVAKAYEQVREVDYLDISKEGIVAWETALSSYRDQISRTENQLAIKLREQLGGAKNADEMFAIFSRFNVLFVRPHIRSAIREFQTQLIERVKADIENLRKKSFDERNMELARRVTEAYDIPEVAAKIMWIRQIESQLKMNMKRVEDVLGDQWANHPEGKDLKKECDILMKQLDTNQIYEEWSQKVLTKSAFQANRLFIVEKQHRDGKVVCRLRVNYAPEIIVVAKEVRNLKNLGFRMPFKIMSNSYAASNSYPFAISLLESMRMYDATNEIVYNRRGVDLLVSSYRKVIHDLLVEGLNISWENFKTEAFATKMAEAVNTYQEKVSELTEILDTIENQTGALDKCQYSVSAISQILSSIQKAVDQLVHNDYSNIKSWLQSLDNTLEQKLARRVEEAIHVWTRELNKGDVEELDEDKESNVSPSIAKIRLDIRISSQMITVSPSLDKARLSLLAQFFAWHGIVTSQPRVTNTRLQLHSTGDSLTYRDVLLRMPHKQQVIVEAFEAINRLMQGVGEYVTQWTQYQALWDLQPDMLYERLGNDLDKWMNVLLEIKKSRSTVDTQDTQHEVFPFVVDYQKVQTKVSVKYDYWQREVLQRFGQTMGTIMQKFYADISKWRADLESQSIDSGTTADAVALITYVQFLKKQTAACQANVDRFIAGQKLLNHNRYQFPKGWLYAENVEGEWTALVDVLRRKDASIQSQIANLQDRILKEDKILEKQINEVLTEWNKLKPVQGSQRPKEAIQLLNAFEDKFNKLKEDLENVVKAKSALEISESSVNVTGVQSINKLDVAFEELRDLSGVWKALLPIYMSLEEMKDQAWLSIQPRKLRQGLDEQMGRLKQLPSQYRSYESYDYTKRLLQNYSKMNLLVIELKSEALKDRHWKQLMKEMNVSWSLNDLTLGQVWDADLAKNEHTIKEILLVAQGEMALDEFMKTVKDYWANFVVDLVGYQQKTKLIRGWDDLFTKLKDHMNSLTAMKLSPYYKQFEEDAILWEERLNKIHSLFDVWIDVQRRWVYLEGLFTGSADIAYLLPTESSRFNIVSTEFLGMMKKVAANPRILDVVNIQGAQKILERLLDMLSKIQKALGEYLERERSSFPRFYFVGDEDLLEILGNSKDIVRVQKHLKKMFAGIMGIDYNEETKIISAIVSREGEKVALANPVNINNVPKVNDWLRELETQMRQSLAKLLSASLAEFSKFDFDQLNRDDYVTWLDKYPAQIIWLSSVTWWTSAVEKCLSKGENSSNALTLVQNSLQLLSDSVLRDQPSLRRKKIESLITELVHKRDVCRELLNKKVTNNLDFHWLKVMRYYFDAAEQDPLKCCVIKVANAQFLYGFEYLGIQERLVQTPLTDRCYLTMTQALHSRLGGSPFGPAGTGKTESVKALGCDLGRFVLVFNCDETFDFQAIGRILVGLCQVGAWGCFDEFNRLEERMLSAVSQQIQSIQESIKAGGEMKVDLVGKSLCINASMAIFITMNPGYSGRSNLPDNLKQLFRSLAMTQPDRKLIAEVMLYSQGFQTAEILAKKIVPLFTLCKEQLSNQSHYDFGLRALKYVLVSAGNIKRTEIQRMSQELNSSDTKDIAEQLPEQQILIQSVCETLTPKLVSEDITLLLSLLQDVFPNVEYKPKQMDSLKQEIFKVCKQMMLSFSDVSGENGYLWLEKILQLYQITNLNHGLMLVGSSGSGKTMAWKVLLKALEHLESIEGVAHVIDAKAMSKDSLYGVLDANTREWTDGLFTHIIRKIIDNVRGEADKRHWIIFDGDVDPEWVENLNSVLDDNKLLTLPNGERLSIPSNVRIIFEVADLKHATLATVSRCGMVWYSEDVVTTEMLFEHFLNKLSCVSLNAESFPEILSNVNEKPSRSLEIQRLCSQFLSVHMTADGLIPAALEFALKNVEHVMEPSKQRFISTFFSMTNFSVKQILEYSASHSDFPLSNEQIENYITRTMLVNIIWSFSGDGKWKCRKVLSDFLCKAATVSLPPNEAHLIIDYNVSIAGGWEPWVNKVPSMEIEAHRVAATDIVVPTMDTVRHELLLNTWLSERKPLVLCGPPGSGKTMTLLSALRSLPDMDVINVNFSSSTTPELLMKNFDHYCEYRRTPNGIVLSPVQMTRWLVIFCDEINLPSQDKYGTQRVISFLRQMVEQNGFYRTSDKVWITLERIQFVGACNPPTDPGRNPMSGRFLRHVPVVYVDYPGQTSLVQIYGTFNRAMLRPMNMLRGLADPLTEAMVEFYLRSQERFTQDDQPHYIYSPRELTRWVRGISEAVSPLDSVTAESLIRLWAHEALRLFHDRLVQEEERDWTDELVDEIAKKYFAAACNLQEALKRPMLYSCWLTRHYMPVSHEELKNYVHARLKGFYEEELDVKLMLDHVLRIDRIYRQPQGHLLLIGVSGSGKTTLSRFVAWLNGLSVYQLKVHSKYTAADFDEDIRQVLRRAGCKNEKICFIMDESNMLDTGFLERLNTLLANGEVPGLFEGDDFTTLMNQIKEGAQRQGLMLDSSEELYKWFTAQIVRNLHVVFTMNPSGNGLRERASTSPALFNRCVLNWFGDWSNSALYQVGTELTGGLDVTKADYVPPAALDIVCDLLPPQISYHNAVVNVFVHVHNTVRRVNETEVRKGHRVMALSPRHFLDYIRHYISLFKEKRQALEDEKIHLNIGLQKIRETQDQIKELQVSLKQKGVELVDKQEAANAKLQQMLADQRDAEKEKQHSENLQQELKKQLEEIAETKKKVGTELLQVEPTVEEAKNAVKGIKKAQLVELKSMNAPPPAVKLAMESICLLLGEDVGTDWKAIRQLIVKEDFITRILQFDTDKVSAETKAAMEKYENNPDWDFEKANRASLACGPLVKWMKAQLAYSRILGMVDPLRRQLRSLENDAKAKTQKGEELKVIIANFEQSIAAYKEEYADLIRQSETIKTDLTSVEQKVARSIQLLTSLRVEADRWQKGCDGFSQQMETLVGDALLSAAFLAYSGYYDQHLREILFEKWSDHLKSAQVIYRSDIARIEYLSTADERLEWQTFGMSKDDLCVENTIMLHRFNRYPLIIDPSGQSVEYLMRQYPNMQKTSFLDNSFRKNLESALRFGQTLVVQDVESYDPILNPVLNREVKRTGGRILITLGDQDIDFSPAFKIYMVTRDSSVEFPPDICSRVTFVNFTVTRSSLETQCLNQALRSERPDIDEKRNDLLKLQGEFAVRLRHLEKALLNALNESKGKILDDDSVVATLEKLKNEAKEVETKAAETDQVIKEVELVSQKYTRLANAASLIYLTLYNLNEVSFLYRYSLSTIEDVFTTALKAAQQNGSKDYDERLSLILRSLFQVAFARVSTGLLHSDKVLLALLLMRIYLKCGTNETQYEPLFDHLLGAPAVLSASKAIQEAASKLHIEPLGNAQLVALLRLASLPAFKNCVSKAQNIDLASWFTSDKPEANVPVLWEDDEKLTSIRRYLNELLVIHALRPDRLLASAHLLVNSAFGTDFMEQDKVINLREIIETEVLSKTPVLLCSAMGYDASTRVEDLAVEVNKEITSIAIGSAEGFNQADAALNSGSKSGRWILLKNVHLAPSWLTQLEKKLHNLKPHPQFRLLLTAEINPKLPPSMIEASRVLVFEPSTGLKANLLRSLSAISPSRFSQMPVERSRLYFLLCWFHAIVQERLRYCPLGWSVPYEFSDADLRVALDTMDAAVDLVALKRSNVNPEKLPWAALITLFSQCIYGGKITNKFDQELLDAFLQKLFTKRIFEQDYVLVKDIDGKSTPLYVPEHDNTTRDKVLMWVNSVKSAQMPNWIGLPNNAEKVLLTSRGQELLRNMMKVSDEELAYDDSLDENKKAPSWMLVLSGHCGRWLQALPETLERLKRTKQNIKDPLFRFFEREINFGAVLLHDIRADLSQILAVCRGEAKQSNHIRSLISALNKGLVPAAWARYTTPKAVTSIEWMNDFSSRIIQLSKLSKSTDLRKTEIWLGGMFSPEAYITATRQLVAQINGWSLEQMCMHVSVGKTTSWEQPFSITGMRAIGAVCKHPNQIHLTDEVYSDIDMVQFSWTRDARTDGAASLPVYLYSNRADLLFCLDFVPVKFEPTLLNERGVALIANSLL